MSTNDSAFERLRAIVLRISKQDIATIGRTDDLRETLGVDSLEALRILANVEKTFGVRFSEEQITAVRSVEQLLEVIESAGPTKGEGSEP